MATLWRALRRDRRGTAAIEFALVLTVFLPLLFAIIAFGFRLATRIALSYAVAEGGRAAVAALSPAERSTLADAAVTRVLTSFSPLIDPAKAAISITDQGPTAEGEAILVAVTYQDSRFAVFPFLPDLAAVQTVQTTYLAGDPLS
jgi:Flp pilus assembly protein TadG